MFDSEKELVDIFIKIMKKKYGKLNEKKEVITTHNTKTDIVINKSRKKISFEAKLNNIIDVWVQALRNKKWYDFSYIVVPESKKNIIMKNFDEFKKNDIGVILVKNKDIEFLNKIDNIF